MSFNIGGPDVLTSINDKLEALLSNSKKSRSGSQAQQIEYNNVFSFQELAVVYNKEDILPHKRHGAIVKKALIKMTTDILKDKKKGFNDEIGDESAVVQKY